MTTDTSGEDRRIEMLLANVLRFGVLISAIVVGSGGIVFLLRNGAAATHYGTFQGEPPALRTVHGTLAEAIAGRGRGLIQLGILLLVATPIARVAFSICTFVWERDRLYVLITLVVLTLLLFSLLAQR